MIHTDAESLGLVGLGSLLEKLHHSQCAACLSFIVEERYALLHMGEQEAGFLYTAEQGDRVIINTEQRSRFG